MHSELHHSAPSICGLDGGVQNSTEPQVLTLDCDWTHTGGRGGTLGGGVSTRGVTKVATVTPASF